MKKLAAALALSLLPLAFAAQAEITTTDVVGRKVTVPDVPKRVVLGFYYEDYLAIAGPGSLDRVVGLSLTTWKDWRPKQ
ncbi:MAG: iron ABC transporter substrate-binding protein, partial [Lautropia mirabilis]